MKLPWRFTLLVVAVVGIAGCSPRREAGCGATPRILCGPFHKLSGALTEQERTAVISLGTAPPGESNGFEKLADRARIVLRFGRDDEVLTYLHQSSVDDGHQIYMAILCGYSRWLKEGLVNMDDLLQKGYGTCWRVPDFIDPPQVPEVVDPSQTVFL